MYSYDICILAHPSDAEAAERLCESIRSYRMPRINVPLQPGVGYQRIRLDTAGQPFDAANGARLDECRQLIVLCSPQVRDSAPIQEKLLHFEAVRGRQSIIAVILDGEPLESFPPFFIERKTVRHIQPDGSIAERIETLEPVASDLRAQRRRQAKALLRYETVRIVASLLGLEPDALERRHAKRAKRRAISTAVTACTICLAVCGTFLYFFILAKTEGDIAAAMTEESKLLIDRLAVELPARFDGNQAAQALVEDSVSEALDLLSDGNAALPPAP